MSNPSEKRKFIRLRANHLTRHIKFKLPGVDLYPNNEAVSKDISAGGVLFLSDRAYEMGDILRMELHIPGWEKYKNEFFKLDRPTKTLPVLVLVKVVRVEALGNGKFDIGVSFVGIDDGHQEALSKYIAHHLNIKS